MFKFINNLFKKEPKTQSKSFEHIRFEFENSQEQLQIKQDIEDNKIKRECELDAEFQFEKILQYNRYGKGSPFSNFGKRNDGKVLDYPLLILGEFSSRFITCHTTSKWNSDSIHNYTHQLIKQKVDKWELEFKSKNNV